MKKNYILFISIIIAVCLSYACSDDDSPAYNSAKDEAKSTAQLLTPETGKTYLLEKDNRFETFETFTWNQSEYSISIGRRYSIEIDLPGNNFAEPVRVTSTTELEAAPTVEEMNEALEKLGLTPDVESKIEMRLVTDAYGGEEGNVLLPEFPKLTSETIELFVTPYEGEDKAMYMIGEEFGNWDWGNANVVEMTPVYGKKGEFWCIRYFQAGKGFKWSPKRLWDGDFNQLDTNTGFIINGGNAEVSADGMYIVYINLDAGTIAMETANVYGMGDCFGGWTTATYPFTINNATKTMEITTTGSGELRMYAASSAATVGGDWWKMEFIILRGFIEYRGNGNDQERVNVAAGKTVILDFNSGTGTIN